jgi:hypothetical protein
VRAVPTATIDMAGSTGGCNTRGGDRGMWLSGWVLWTRVRRGRSVTCPRFLRQGLWRLRGQGRPQAVAIAIASVTLEAGGTGP